MWIVVAVTPGVAWDACLAPDAVDAATDATSARAARAVTNLPFLPINPPSRQCADTEYDALGSDLIDRIEPSVKPIEPRPGCSGAGRAGRRPRSGAGA